MRRGLAVASLGLCAFALFVACAQLAGIDEGHLAHADAEPDVDADAVPDSDADVDVDAQQPIVVPDGMVLIAVPSGGSFLIDAKETTVEEYEAVRAMGVPSNLVACPPPLGDRTTCTVKRQGSRTMMANQPANCVTWCDAALYCAAKGKRLCGAIGGGSLGSIATDPRDNEWARACGGAEGNPYPYGKVFEAGACDVFPGDAATLPEAGAPAPRTSCEGSVRGLYDMGGSLAEWTNGRSETSFAFVEGAAYRYSCADRAADCTCQNIHLSSVGAQDDVGIRCCKDATGP